MADVLYDTEWYKCDARTRKMILMILRRSQRAKTIAVPFFTPSLPAFGSVMEMDSIYILYTYMIINVYVFVSTFPDTQHNRLIYHTAEDISVSLRGV